MANEDIANEKTDDQPAIETAAFPDIEQLNDSSEPLTEQEQAELKEQSADFVGQWNGLISTTNWEKGKIISEWQKSVAETDLPQHSYSDQYWANMVGGVTPQHVGRLRRTHDRFGHVFTEYKGLYWSHFYAALEWDDAEMWLEGAVQSDWSVAGMRKQRWETLGSDPKDKPKVDHIVVSEPAEEEKLALMDAGGDTGVSEFDQEYTQGPRPDGPDFGDEEPTGSGKDLQSTDALEAEAANQGPRVRPFESFTNLPDDISSAASAFKVAIIRHKNEEWDEISVDDLSSLLDALKQLATAASE